MSETQPHSAPRDTLGRPMHDLRISVTDRCNLRCTYCMPEEHFGEKYEFLQRSDLLSFEEVTTVARAAAVLGVKKLRLTGGEPLLRRDLHVLVSMLREIPGIEDIALTTNGLLLSQLAQPLKGAGVDRITVSLDSLDDALLARISGRPITSAQVLAGVDAARDAGFAHLKVNAVIQRGVNDEQVLPLAEYFRGTGVILRFIEFMDVGTLNHWNLAAVVPAVELRDAITARYPLEAADPNYAGEVATRYRYADGQGEIGFISSVSQPFCRDCSRLRLSADGELYTCLFAGRGHALKPMLRAGASLEAITEHLRAIWSARDDRYSAIRTEATARTEKVEMYHIGG